MFNKFHAVITVCLMAAMSQAIFLPPGGRVGRNNAEAPGTLTLFADAGTLVADTTGTFDTGGIRGSVISAVFRNPNGELDFGFELATTETSDPIQRITLSNFGLFTTDVGYVAR